MPELLWEGKSDAVVAAKAVLYRLLEADDAISYGDANTENMIIQGDNLAALKALLPYYKGSVRCVYADPPYNTGSAFEHYDDNLVHSTWLSLMYPRLELMRDLLSEDGSIWISIVDTECHYLKIICDEIFGRDNFEPMSYGKRNMRLIMLQSGFLIVMIIFYAMPKTKMYGIHFF